MHRKPSTAVKRLIGNSHLQGLAVKEKEEESLHLFQQTQG